MVKNIDNLAMRGERLELLVNKTENLTNNVSLIDVQYYFSTSIIILLIIITKKNLMIAVCNI